MWLAMPFCEIYSEVSEYSFKMVPPFIFWTWVLFMNVSVDFKGIHFSRRIHKLLAKNFQTLIIRRVIYLLLCTFRLYNNLSTCMELSSLTALTMPCWNNNKKISASIWETREYHHFSASYFYWTNYNIDGILKEVIMGCYTTLFYNIQ